MPDRHSPAGAPCPAPEVLAAYLREELPAAALRETGGHLSDCPSCRSVMERLDEVESRPLCEFLGGGRGALAELANDSWYQRMIEVAARAFPVDPDGEPDDPPPAALGQYEVKERIGRGGMGAVYRGWHPLLKKSVALKVLARHRVADRQAVARIRREMEAVAQLDHPNIVRATDAGEQDGVPFLVMELVDGIDLGQIIRRCGPVPVADACELVRQAALGLHHAHEQGMIHRDVKPQNLMLTRKGEVKVLDLGLALVRAGAGAGTGLTHSGQLLGTPDYMAPEHWEGCHTIDARADIYSLGCTLYALLTGRPPFAGAGYSSYLRKMAAHAREPVPPVTAARPDTPPVLAELVHRMLAKAPGERPATAAEIARALEPLSSRAGLERLGTSASSAAPEDQTRSHAGGPEPHTLAPVEPRTVTLDQTRRRRWPLAVAGTTVALLATLATVVVVALSRPRDGTDPPGTGEQPARPAAAALPPPPKPPGAPARKGWKNLLTARPGTRLWPTAVGARLDFDEKPEVVRIDCPKAALLSIGDTDAPAYRLHFGFRQIRWTGGFGVYFGGRARGENGEFHFQFLHLSRFPGPEDRAFTLGRAHGVIRGGPGGEKAVADQGFASTKLPRPPSAIEQILEIEVRPRWGLVSARWNGGPCVELVTADANARFQDGDYGGEFGIYCSGTTVTVSTARFQEIE